VQLADFMGGPIVEAVSPAADDTLARIEALVRESRQAVLDGVEQILARQAEPLLERTRAALLASTEAVLREQTEPLLARIRELLLQTADELNRRHVEPAVGRTREMMLALVEEVVKRHATPLIGEFRAALQRTVEELVQSQMDPILAKARQSVRESAQLATEFADVIVGRLRVTVAEPTGELLRRKLPGYAHWAGRRALDYVLAGTLFALAAVFLSLGSVFGLQHAGMAPFATYLVVGSVALVAGLVFLLLSVKALPFARVGPADVLSDCDHKR
jgi:hypothetical protein